MPENTNSITPKEIERWEMNIINRPDDYAELKHRKSQTGQWVTFEDHCRVVEALRSASRTICEAHTNVQAPHCPICLVNERDALRVFYEGVKECMEDTWQCVRCGNAEPWWTECNADYATREAVKTLSTAAAERDK
jgi:hypothetical protein